MGKGIGEMIFDDIIEAETTKCLYCGAKTINVDSIMSGMTGNRIAEKRRCTQCLGVFKYNLSSKRLMPWCIDDDN